MNPYLPTDGNEAALARYMAEQDAQYRMELAVEKEKESLMKLPLEQLEESINGKMWAQIDEILNEIAAEIVMDYEPDDPEADQPEPEWR